MRKLSPLAALVVVLAVVGCVAEAPAPAALPDNRAADEAALRAALKQWSAAAEAKDAARFASFYTQDGILMLEGAPDQRGMAAVKEGTAAMMSDPNFSLTFGPDKVEVARSGDLAYDTGSYTLTMTGPDGEPVTQTGYYVDVWKKNEMGEWKVAVDAPVSDLPEQPAGE